ncbi:MAG: hypothetical protein RRC34_07580 [Lentisphaeria bacterium]|nr:hypothetical protein [Lentisphaeria bacterium]
MMFSRNMYYWRRLSPEERADVLKRRKAHTEFLSPLQGSDMVMH